MRLRKKVMQKVARRKKLGCGLAGMPSIAMDKAACSCTWKLSSVIPSHFTCFKVKTVDGFQGNEQDIIVISAALRPQYYSPSFPFIPGPSHPEGGWVRLMFCT